MDPREDERRVHPRYEKTFEIEGAFGSAGAPTRLVASNVSLGGLYCTSDRDFPEMTRLAVRLMLPGRGAGAGELEPLDVSAVVVRRRELPTANLERYELALLFTALTATQRERLARFLSHA